MKNSSDAAPGVPSKGRRGQWSKRLHRMWRKAIFRLLLLLVGWCGPFNSKRAVLLSRATAGLSYRCRPWTRRKDLANLALALGETTPPERRLAILRESLRTSSAVALQLLQLIRRPRDFTPVLDLVAVSGAQHLEAALARGRGVIGISAHLGNFAVTPLWLAHAGFPVTMVIREAKHVPVGLFRELFPKLGIDAVVVDSDRQAAQALIGALKRNCVVMIYLDQDAKRGGLELPFLGKLTPIPMGPAVLARRTGAAVVPMFSFSRDDAQAVLEVLPALPLSDLGEAKQAVAQDVETMARLVESYIKRYPEQWGWRYRRWRDRPAVSTQAVRLS